MKTVYFYTYADECNIFDSKTPDKNQTYIGVKNLLEDLGYKFKFNRYPDNEGALYIFWNVNHNDSYIEFLKRLYRRYRYKKINPNFSKYYKEAIKKKPSKMILVLWEGISVMPELYENEQYMDFDVVYTWNDKLVDDKKIYKYNMPVPGDGSSLPRIQYNNKKFICMIAYNKSSNSIGESYSERLKAINFFQSVVPEKFDLYGFGWSKHSIIKNSCYKGSIQKKLPMLSQYKFNICFENNSILEGYVSEKIFDCFRAGTIPIYLGATNISEIIPKSTFINFRDFDSYDELYQYISNITEEKYLDYIFEIDKFLDSDAYKNFSLDAFLSLFKANIP